MSKHFEDLWGEAEALYKDNINHLSQNDIIQELLLKINLFKALEGKTLSFAKDQVETKTRMLGEILLTIAQLSAKDNINVYEGMLRAVKFRSSDDQDSV